ncbi:hypothetical protein [Streptomyces echinatus]|uniref:hypothetical protein n=1 Tax=Streptomyces echinatus TaxID=67293 RepID=UPI0031E54162
MKDYHLRAVAENAEPAGRRHRPRRRPDPPPSPRASRSSASASVWREITALRVRGARSDGARDRPRGPRRPRLHSGSTAAPKAVICPHGRMVFATEAINLELGYRPDDVVFCRFPSPWDLRPVQGAAHRGRPQRDRARRR